MDGESVQKMELNSAFTEHPLLNSLIVSHIFELLQKSSYITAKNVNNLRYVCKTWYSLSLPIFRPVATIRLGPALSSSECSSFSKPLFPIAEFLELFQNPDNDPYEFQKLPFQSYLIRNLTITDYSFLKDINDPQNFWNTVGSFVNQLTFENCVFPGNDTKIFKQILNEKLPNLQKLILLNNINYPLKSTSSDIDDVDVEVEARSIQDAEVLSQGLTPRNRHLKYFEVSGQTPMDEVTLLINSFNLETLKVRSNLFWDYTVDTIISVWSLLNKYRNHLGGRPECKLKCLDVMHSTFFDCFPPMDDMQQYNFPLETITLDLKPDTGSDYHDCNPNIDVDIESAVLPLLEFHANSLKVLKIYRPPVFAESQDNPFRWLLPNLEELHIWGNLVRNFEFLKNMPNLKVLMINPFCYDKAEIMQSEYYEQNSDEQLRVFSKRYIPFKGDMLEGLSLYQSEYICLKCMEELHLDLKFGWTEILVRVLARWMPNLKKFRGNLNTMSFRAVCKWMPNLEELGILYEGHLNNETVTGISENVRVDRNVYNITRLKNLKRFYQQLPACDYTGYLSDQSVLEGFLKMESLEYISIYVSSQMSRKAETALKERVANVNFIRNYEDPHIGDGDCCKRKDFFKCCFF